MNNQCNTKLLTISHAEFIRNFTKQRLQFICHKFNAKMKNELNKN